MRKRDRNLSDHLAHIASVWSHRSIRLGWPLLNLPQNQRRTAVLRGKMVVFKINHSLVKPKDW